MLRAADTFAHGACSSGERRRRQPHGALREAACVASHGSCHGHGSLLKETDVTGATDVTNGKTSDSE